MGNWELGYEVPGNGKLGVRELWSTGDFAAWKSVPLGNRKREIQGLSVISEKRTWGKVWILGNGKWELGNGNLGNGNRGMVDGNSKLSNMFKPSNAWTS